MYKTADAEIARFPSYRSYLKVSVTAEIDNLILFKLPEQKKTTVKYKLTWHTAAKSVTYSNTREHRILNNLSNI